MNILLYYDNLKKEKRLNIHMKKNDIENIFNFNKFSIN
jgi:hypothetical protein